MTYFRKQVGGWSYIAAALCFFIHIFSFILEAAGQQPCVMCLLQRWLFLALAVALVFHGVLIASAWQPLVWGVSMATAVAGLGVAGWQTYLQLNPPQTDSCVLSLSWMDHLQAASPDCSKVDVVYFGMSLAQWSASFFLMMLLGLVLGYVLTVDEPLQQKAK